MNIQMQHSISAQTNRISRAGFTLVEMLVSTGLVVLIMTLFAQVYSTAVGTMTEQRGMGNNDQKARILTSILHNDLKYITYRQSTKPGATPGIVPFVPLSGAVDPGNLFDFENQRGYFYFSENERWDPTDDVLQFTTEVTTSNDDDYYVGKAEKLPNSIPAMINNPDQDDGEVGNSRGQSQAAEVTYFLRNGTLYRRVLMLRSPQRGADEQPGDSLTGGGTRYFSSNGTNPIEDYTLTGRSFWNDYDYSATRSYASPPVENTNGKYSHLVFNGINSLVNGPLLASLTPIAIPCNRFGHLNDPRGSSPNHGHPREFVGTDFIGRFTHEETSSENMDFPGVETGASYRIFDKDHNDPDDDYLLNDEGIVKKFEDGDRFGEDILLTNVEAFDVEVWEAGSGKFVQLGAGEAEFGEASGNRNNPGYGPRGGGRNFVFDTWFPELPTSSVTGGPPWLPVDSSLVGGISPRDWEPNEPYSAGERVKVPEIKVGEDIVYYEVIQGGTTGNTPPSFNLEHDALTVDNEVIWKCVDARLGLRAIRITIRFIDVQSRLPRQVTVVHSFAK